MGGMREAGGKDGPGSFVVFGWSPPAALGQRVLLGGWPSLPCLGSVVSGRSSCPCTQMSCTDRQTDGNWRAAEPVIASG